ncbi:MAG: hypothetical protein MJY43_00470 [Bacteroidales bacterium]|nr:hypothetical protein [Bacteroidales bacterium]
MKKRFLVCALALSAAACTPSGFNAEPGGNGFDESASALDEIILGRQLEDPYEVSNMAEALKSLYPTKAGRTEITATDRYVRFLPADDADMQRLLEAGVEMLDHPVDFEILREGDYYHDPSVPDGKITWQYGVVPLDFDPPAGILCEELHECFLIDNAPDVKAAGGDIDWEAVERESFRLTGNGSMVVPQAKAGQTSGVPCGRISIMDEDYDPEPIGVPGVKVSCNVFVKMATAYTDERGYYKMSKEFNSDLRYRIVFSNRKGFNIGFNLILVPGSVSTLGKHGPEGCDVTIDGAKDGALFRRAVVNNAAYDYYSSCKSSSDGNIKTPPANLRIWIFPFMSRSCAPMFQQGVIINSDLVTTLLGNYTFLIKMFLPDVILGVNGCNDYASLYRRAIHELAHSSHYMQVGTDYWETYFYHFVSSWISSSGVTYGVGTEENHGYCEVSEMWAYYMENAFHRDRYPDSYRFEGTSYWFYPQIFMYLDEKGVNRYRIFRALTSDVHDRDILKAKLSSLYPECKTIINEAFIRYN